MSDQTPSVRGNKRLRFLDRCVGIPAVAALGLLPKRRHFDYAGARRIGLMKTAGIGDMLMLAGIVADLKKALPNTTIILISGEDNRSASALIAADEHLAISPLRPLAAVRAVRAARLDV